MGDDSTDLAGHALHCAQCILVPERDHISIHTVYVYVNLPMPRRWR